MQKKQVLRCFQAEAAKKGPEAVKKLPALRSELSTYYLDKSLPRVFLLDEARAPGLPMLHSQGQGQGVSSIFLAVLVSVASASDLILSVHGTWTYSRSTAAAFLGVISQSTTSNCKASEQVCACVHACFHGSVSALASGYSEDRACLHL